MHMIRQRLPSEATAQFQASASVALALGDVAGRGAMEALGKHVVVPPQWRDKLTVQDWLTIQKQLGAELGGEDGQARATAAMHAEPTHNE